MGDVIGRTLNGSSGSVVILLISRSSVPRLRIVRFKLLKLPTETSPKSNAAGETLILGSIPVPNNDTSFCGEFGSLLSMLNSPGGRILPTFCGVKVTSII